MKRTIISLVLTLLAICGRRSDNAVASQTKAAPDVARSQSSGGPDAHIDAPKRKSGWWEFTSGGDSRQNLCVTDATEAVYSAFDQVAQKKLNLGTCSKTDFHKNGGGWAFEIECDTGIPAIIGGGLRTSKGTISGNINTAYEVQMSVTQVGETNKGTIKGAWKGECPAGRKAGDLVTSGGTVVNVLK